MIADLPTVCDIGTKRKAKGHTTRWPGYKVHIDAADGAIPIRCLLTSASLHDSQAALPLATRTASRVTYCYEWMDAAYDGAEIHQNAVASGHVALIDPNPRRDRDRKERRAADSPLRHGRSGPPGLWIHQRNASSSARASNG